MRVAFVMWPTAAHLYPMIPLAWAARAAGHEVCVVSHPSIGGLTSIQGLPFAAFCDADAIPVPMGPGGAWPQGRMDVGRVTGQLNLPFADMGTWITFGQFLLPCMWDFLPYKSPAGEPMPAMDGLVTFFQGWRPDLVIWDPTMPGAAVAARVVGARQARFTGPDYVGWSLDALARAAGDPSGPDIENPLIETIRPMAERYGVPVDRETLYGEWTINPMPPMLTLPVRTRTLPMQWIPHVSQNVMPDWLYPVPKRPRIAISLGVSTRQYIAADWSHVAILLDALGELDVEVVAMLNDIQMEHVVKVPDNIRVIDFFPLDQLAPTCAAVIHHGGFGSLITAGRAKVPQIVVDFLEFEIGATAAEDGTISGSRYPLAPLTGAFVTTHGAGEVMDLSRPTVDGIRDQVTRFLAEPAYHAGAVRMYEDLALSPSPSAILDLMERIVRS